MGFGQQRPNGPPERGRGDAPENEVTTYQSPHGEIARFRITSGSASQHNHQSGGKA